MVRVVRAKFVCESKRQSADGEGAIVNLRAVSEGSPENAEFFRYTPAGYVTLSTVNPAAADRFEQGQEYYLDFTPVIQKPE